MTTPPPNRRWFHLTPARFFVGLLGVQVLLLLSERLQWFAFNEQKGWTVLIAVGLVCVVVVVALIWGLVCLCLRRRFQFGFRSLLLFMVAVSMPLGWFAWEMQKARKQREVVEAIWEAGGHVMHDYEPGDPFADPQECHVPMWLLNSLGQDFFCDAISCWTRRLGSPNLDDDAAKYLKQLPTLKALRLDYTQVSDSGLAHLKTLELLTDLCLGGTPITDAGLVHLEGLTSLELLSLDQTRITDAGLVHLEGLTSLELLDLHYTQVTDEGVKMLQQALPNCEIAH
jgi:hypothetical protein